MNLPSAYSNLPKEITAPDKQGVRLCEGPSITELSCSRYRDVISRGLPSRQLPTTYNPIHLAIRGSIFPTARRMWPLSPGKRTLGQKQKLLPAHRISNH